MTPLSSGFSLGVLVGGKGRAEGEVWAFSPLALSLRGAPGLSVSMTLLSFCNHFPLSLQTPLLLALGITPCDFLVPCPHFWNSSYTRPSSNHPNSSVPSVSWLQLDKIGAGPRVLKTCLRFLPVSPSLSFFNSFFHQICQSRWRG